MLEQREERLTRDVSETSAVVAERSLQFMSDSFDDFRGFRKLAQDKICRLTTRLAELSKKVDKIGSLMDEIQEYRFNICKRFTALYLTRKPRETTRLMGEATSNVNVFTNKCCTSTVILG